MTCFSRLFHSLIILDVKNIFIFVVCLGFSSLRLCFPGVGSGFPGVQFEEAFLAPTLSKPLRILEVSIISPVLSVASKVVRPRLDNRSS